MRTGDERLPYPEVVTIVEVGPRDGLQNEPTIVGTDDKLGFVMRCVQAGLREIEVTSFVHPSRVPQMADAEDLVAMLPHLDGVTCSALVLNERGVERALAAGVTALNFVVLASESFNRRNQGTSIEGSLDALRSLAASDHRPDLHLALTIGASFGCPFEGEVPLGNVMNVAEAGLDLGVDEICLADTIGVAVPRDVTTRVKAVATTSGDTTLRCHFHDTRSLGIANALAAVDAGVRVLDASLGGFGGCPFAPAATGNIATEDLVYALTRTGIETGTTVDRLAPHVAWLEGVLGRDAPGLLCRAGDFPPGVRA